MTKNLVLTGMMGVGKTTVGKKLASKLSFNFIDIDNLIEAKEKTSIANIFKIKGESYFRLLESKITLNQLDLKNTVISLGGGAFLNNLIRKKVKSSSVSFWLDVSLERLIRRLSKSKKRPLLIKKNLGKTISKIYLARRKTYNLSDYRIKCESLKIDEIVDKIENLYEKQRDKI